MKLKTHAFREAYIAGRADGFVLHVTAQADSSRSSPSYLTQKFDDHHLCLFVFATPEAADEERKVFPAHLGITVVQVPVSEIRAFTTSGFGLAVLVFLRDGSGAFAPL